MGRPTVHIIGAGLAGLAAAVRLTGGPRDVVLHEAARHAGGRCRSYFDPALGITIDNGNHLLLSGNSDARNYLAAIGAEDQLTGPPDADFAFMDLATGERWRLRPNAGAFPWWIFSRNRRVPGTGPSRLPRPFASSSSGQGRAGRRGPFPEQCALRAALAAVFPCRPEHGSRAKAHRNSPRPWYGKRWRGEGGPAVPWWPGKACRRLSSTRLWSFFPSTAPRSISSTGCEPSVL